MAESILDDRQIGAMAGRTASQLTRDFMRAGLDESQATHMAEAISQRVGNEIRNEVRVRGHQLIAQQRTQLTGARDALAALQNAPEGTPTAAVYDALVARFGEERINDFMAGMERGLEALDNWDDRIDGQAWTLAELGDAARDVARERGWLNEGSLAADQVQRGNPLEHGVEMTDTAVHGLLMLKEVGMAIIEAQHSVALGAASLGGAVFTGAALVIHHIAEQKHEHFVHGMQHLFEAAR